MKKYFFLAILTILLSCKKDDPLPTACFTLSKTSADVNESITATNCSANATDYTWEDTDGGYSTNKDVVFIYSAPGTYFITLTAYNGANHDVQDQAVTIVHKTGSVSFWQSGTPSYANTTVGINGLVGLINLNYPNGIIDCTTSGCANFILTTGTYTFNASDGSYDWNGSVTIVPDQCIKYQLQ